MGRQQRMRRHSVTIEAEIEIDAMLEELRDDEWATVADSEAAFRTAANDNQEAALSGAAGTAGEVE